MKLQKHRSDLEHVSDSLLYKKSIYLGMAMLTADITTHYSAVELQELITAVEKIVDRNIAQSPTLTIVKRSTTNSVGK